jgi:tripartite-type tricarboxylate transporter receptor subunit TctC
MVARLGVRLAIALAAIALALTPAAADELDILKGKTIRFIVGSDASSGTHRYARPFADELEKLLPDTTIRVQALPGAGSLVALAEALNASGSVITMVAGQYSPIYVQMLKPEEMSFSLDDFHWIGALTNNQRTLAVRRSMPEQTFAGLLARDQPPVALIDGSGSPGHYELRLITAMTGLDVKMVTGIEDDQRLAILMAGDGDMVLNSYYQLDRLVDSGELTPVLRFGSVGYPPALDSLPTIAEVARPGTPPELIDLLESFDKIGRPISAAPSTPPEIVAALRVAFDRVVAGPGLAEAYRQADLVLAPTSGEEIAARIHEILGRTETLALMKEYLACSERLGPEMSSHCD